MLWSFQRGAEQLVYEIRRAVDGDGFELLIAQHDGTETIERFDDHVAVDRRAAELRQQLLDQGWWVAGDPRR